MRTVRRARVQQHLHRSLRFSPSLPACADANCEECGQNRRCTKCKAQHALRNGTCVAYQSHLCLNNTNQPTGCEECRHGTTSFVSCADIEPNVTCAYFTTTAAGTACHSYYAASQVAGVEAACAVEEGLCVACAESFRFERDGNDPPTCAACGGHCTQCNATACLACADGAFFTGDRSACEPPGKTSSNRTCGEGEVLHLGTCQACGAHCVTCADPATCTVCGSGYVEEGGACVSLDKAGCAESNGRGCQRCGDGRFMNETRCVANTGGCLHQAPSGCMECAAGAALDKEPNGDTSCGDAAAVVSCAVADAKGCLRCADGYYVRNGLCQLCDVSCRTCGEEAGRCTSCPFGSVFTGGGCESVTSNIEGCQTFITNSAQCAICKEGFLLVDGSCQRCAAACKACQRAPDLCVGCNDDGYFYDEETNACNATSALANCTAPSTSGCAVCADGFYRNVHQNGRRARRCARGARTPRRAQGVSTSTSC